MASPQSVSAIVILLCWGCHAAPPTEDSTTTETTTMTTTTEMDSLEQTEPPVILTEEQQAALDFLESIDMKEAVKDESVVKYRVDCIVDQGECDEVGTKVKGLVRFLQTTDCQQCTVKQRVKLLVAVKKVKHSLPAYYKKILDFYNKGVEPEELEYF